MSTGNSNDRHDGVLDSDGGWEDALSAGQSEEGHAGSVEPELAVIHLLRHARAPEPLADARLDAVWSAIDLGEASDARTADAGAEPWWKRPWSWLGGTALAAAAAAVVLVIVIPREQGGEGGGDSVAQNVQPDRPDRPDQPEALATQAQLIEQQFAILAPAAREQAEREVEGERDTLRGRLLADAAAAADGTDGKVEGGAP